MNIAPWLLLALVALPVLEIWFLVKLVGMLGLILTVALLFGAASIGMALLRSQGFATWTQVQHELAQGRLPAERMIESAILAVGGVLLVIPGFLTDFLALPCLIPATRRRLALYLMRHARIVGQRGAGLDESAEPKVIEGEFRREE